MVTTFAESHRDTGGKILKANGSGPTHPEWHITHFGEK
jgi:hypothetical protein